MRYRSRRRYSGGRRRPSFRGRRRMSFRRRRGRAGARPMRIGYRM